MNPISVFCPVTNLSVDSGVETDWSTYFGVRNSTLRVRCPQCGGRHEVPLRESYLARSEASAAIDGGRPPDNPRIDSLLAKLPRT
jgi:hypothetical protein